MSILPNYIGPCAFGLKMGVITPGCDLVDMVSETIGKCNQDNFLDDGDVICITESIVARAQDNFVTTDDIANELRKNYGVKEDSKLGVLFPITSRNRFALILKGIARAVPRGEVLVQFSYPCDEVGNQIIAPEEVNSSDTEKIDVCVHIEGKCVHPITNMNYPAYYKKIIENEGARAKIYLSNEPQMIAGFNPNCVIVSNVHERKNTWVMVHKHVPRCITLQDICNDSSLPAWSEWGLLGSNMSSENMLNLAPRNGDEFARGIQEKIKEKFNKEVEILIYGDGAYKDPTSGIYELADPQPSFGTTMGFKGRMREGVKYKYLADMAHNEGKSVTEIEEMLTSHRKKRYEQTEMVTEGTTPRKMEDLIASLADLVSGSADAGTPVVLVKGFFNDR